MLAVVLVLGLVPWAVGGRPRSGDADPSPTPTARPTLRSAASWAAEFDGQWRVKQPSVLAQAGTGDSWQQYSLAYYVDGLTSAYLATGRTGYVRDGLALLDAVADSSVPSRDLPASRFRDRFRGWASQNPENRGDEVALYESYLWRYGTGLLRVVRQDPALYGDPAIRADYDRLLALAAQDVFEKWRSRGAGTYIQRERVHLSAHWGLIALNLYLVTPDGEARRHYAEVVRQLMSGAPESGNPGLRQQLVASPTEPTAWFWSDVWGSYEMPGQDVSHGNAVVTFAVEAHDLGVAMSEQDLARFTRTFSAVVWPRPGPGAYAVSGAGRGIGWFSDGFVKLGRYDAHLQRRLEDHEPANSQFFAAMALNAAILSCEDGQGSPAAGDGAAAAPPACRPPVGLSAVEADLGPPS